MLGRIEAHLGYGIVWNYYRDNEIKSILKKHVSDTTLIDLVSRHSANIPIITNAQFRFYWLTNQPVIGFATVNYSKTEWTIERVRQITEQYKVKYVIFFPKLFAMDDLEKNKNQHFFIDVMNKKIPSFLRMVFTCPEVEIYQVLSKS
jgi:hypothetical protein